ncbi:hypothetical protein SAMN02745729_102174 [Marinobacterium iners DSM 11526]|jgi:RNase P subunit RPR2|uniref:Uncharacterized protein n=1 Tax=Marinobacterium iners DSM 11526 TaxID=1122198 RepID=A0A1H3ZUR8_9GAMM|nr:hypothetical protein SAMN02745729_102174 [Marinobacterium iners DSM 11526]
MEQICQHCRTLLSSGVLSRHHLSISKISDSELIKCDLCDAYLLSEQDHREVLSTRPATDATLNFQLCTSGGSYKQLPH